MENNYKFFNNKQCEFFPCHKGIPQEKFNCLFCYCPLYNMKNCGGNYTILDNGIKDCSNCLLPHFPESYDNIIKKLYNKLNT